MATIINYKKFDNLEIAQHNALKEVGDSGGAHLFPVTIFNQGERDLLSTVFPVYYIVSDLKSKPTTKGSGVYDVKSNMNRPLDPKHANATKEYLHRNFKTKYILPAMTLNIQEPINIYTADYKSSIRSGFMVIPYGIKLSITDGQHRKKALEDLCKELSEDDFNIIKNNGICVMITVENDINQIHQDFADCSKTKELPKSLIAVYDKRNPANGIVIDLLDNCVLFKDKIDASSNTLSKKSTKLFLVSQVRSAIKELFLGNSSIADVDLESRAVDIYESSDDEKYKRDVKRYIYFINKITEAIPILKKVSEMKDGIQTTKIPELRSEYLILNSAGFNIVCRIGHELILLDDDNSAIDKYVEELAKIDWRKAADLWQGNIVQQGSSSGIKIMTSNSTFKLAAMAVKKQIGLSKEEEELDNGL
jgi:DGQHR domain-containing protein